MALISQNNMFNCIESYMKTIYLFFPLTYRLLSNYHEKGWVSVLFPQKKIEAEVGSVKQDGAFCIYS